MVPAGGGAVERPFHLRFGWPRDAQTLRERRTIGPFGFDRVLVSGAADYFRLELPEALRSDDDEAGLEVTTLEPEYPFAPAAMPSPSPRRTCRRWRRSGPPPTPTGRPWSRSAAPSASRTSCSTSLAPASASSRRAPSSSKYWISTVHAGPAGDAIEPTAILVRRATAHDGAKRTSEVLASETVALSGVAGWARRFNLLDTASLYVKVEQAGTYVLQSRGVAAQFRLEPLFLDALSGGLAVAADAQRAGRVAARSGLLRPDAAAGRGRDRRDRDRRQGGAAGGGRCRRGPRSSSAS